MALEVSFLRQHLLTRLLAMGGKSYISNILITAFAYSICLAASAATASDLASEERGENDIAPRPETWGAASRLLLGNGSAVTGAETRRASHPHDLAGVHDVVGVERLLDLAHHAHRLAVLGEEEINL